MSEAYLEVTRSGAGNSVQDRGRYGLRRYGVNVSGPMDWVSHALALRLADAPADGPAFEIGPMGMEVEARRAPVLLGVAGPGTGGVRTGADGARTVLPAPFRLVLSPGERLLVRAGAVGNWSYLATAGLDVGRKVMRAHATNLRTGLGPHPPQAGGGYACAAAADARGHAAFLDPLMGAETEGGDETLVRVLPGPQWHLFEPDVRERLAGAHYEVTNRRDRMGMALDGPPLPCAAGHDIVSDAMVEGAMQIPGDGRPLVLCADRAPTGGYPKLAIVARASLPLLTQARTGERVRFAWTDVAEAQARSQALRQAIERPLPRGRAPLSADFLRAFAADLR